MSGPIYSVGDTVVLKNGILRTLSPELTCRIVAVLPEAQGMVQYRVRFGSETFERRVSEADIDRAASPVSRGTGRPTSPSATSSWVNPNSIRIKK
jgi:hypothetical protein